MSGETPLIYTPAAVRELDRVAIEQCGIPGYVLMTRAGQAAFYTARARFPDAHRWLVLCGAGNNAGDGYVIARLAREAGMEVTVCAVSDPDKLTGDAAVALADFRSAGGEVGRFSELLCASTDLVVDALLGTGLDRALEGIYRQAVDAVNAAGRPVIAIDIPSGLNGLTGEVMGAAVRAAVTVTFVGAKQGLYLGAGPDCCGVVVFDSLGIPAAATAATSPSLRVFTATDAAALLRRRTANRHKGDFGHVLVIGGNHGLGGAVRLAGEAALRSGAGLVSIATRPDNVAPILAARPELMCRGVADAGELETLLERATVIAIGPGLGRDDWARELLAAALRAASRKVIDADALNLLAADPRPRDDWILTPHPGEAGRLLKRATAEVQRDRPAAAEALCRAYGGAVVLKGHGTLVARCGELSWLIRGGNPGMATAGMGDVLTGVVAGILAQNASADLQSVAATAAWVHARAGDAAAVRGERGLIAGDLFEHLRPCLNPGG